MVRDAELGLKAVFPEPWTELQSLPVKPPVGLSFGGCFETRSYCGPGWSTGRVIMASYCVFDVQNCTLQAFCTKNQVLVIPCLAIAYTLHLQHQIQLKSAGSFSPRLICGMPCPALSPPGKQVSLDCPSCISHTGSFCSLDLNFSHSLYQVFI